MALNLVGSTAAFNNTSVDEAFPAVVSEAPTTLALVAEPSQRNSVNLADLEAAGFAGLVFDWTAFPMISLKTDGQFEDSNGQTYGKGFECKVIGSKIKYAHSFTGSTNPKTDLIYSYDKITSTSGKDVVSFESDLRAAGKEVTCKEYLEVMVELVAPGESHDGEFRLVSVSPTSKGRFSSLIFKLVQKGIKDTAVIRMEVGEKVRNVANPFYPWSFVLVSG